MPEPQELTNGVGDLLQKGLGIFNQGITGIASVLQAGDTAVKSLDGSLTGRRMSNPSSIETVPDGVVANQVVNLVRQARAAASQTQDPQAPGVVRGFQQAMGLLLQQDMPVTGELADLMPSPTEVVRMGLRDLRGSMALARLAQGVGTMEDVTQVALFTEDLVGRVQQTLARAPGAQPDSSPKPRQTKANPKTPRKRRPRKKKETGLTQQPPPEGDIALAQAVAEEMRDDLVTGWFKEFEQGQIPEEEWVGRIGQYAHKRGLEGLDEIMKGANARLEDVLARRASGQS
jgi:hypothetical protein